VEGLLPLAAAFALVALLEFGDKTQLATISLASRHPWPPVFAGAAAGLIAATAVGVAVGGALAMMMVGWLFAVKVAGGIAFIAFGLWGYFRHEEEHGEDDDARSAFVQAFALNLLAEMGDKTQIAVVVLAASEAAPASVFAGASAGLVAVTAVSLFIGKELAKRLPEARVRLVSTALFLGAGILLIAEAVLGG
jgi:putative Ca2+/H+ antiporter (TMEM165/GDT1 family)